MVLLFDIGNTHTHLGLANRRRIVKQANLPTAAWHEGRAGRFVEKFVGRASLDGVALCSVVPSATPSIRALVRRRWRIDCLELSPKTIRGVGIDYPRPRTIGPDRLANAVAVARHFGAPAVVVDFGTAVTFDVVDSAGNYVGGIITPGLAAMTDYLHEKTALLPRIKIREVKAIIGRNTEQAMLIGAVHGYRGLIRGLIAELKKSLRAKHLPVVATGGYARLIAKGMPEITAVRPLLTLEGLRLVWEAHHAPAHRKPRPPKVSPFLKVELPNFGAGSITP
jgi:type III pantothenate kinase